MVKSAILCLKILMSASVWLVLRIQKGVNDTDELYDIVSYTFDWEYNPIPGLTITGESSYADTIYSESSTSADRK